MLIPHTHSVFDHPSALAVWSLFTTFVKYAFDAAVGSMEAPDTTSTRQYRFWFKFLNRFAANIERAKLSDRGKWESTDASGH